MTVSLWSNRFVDISKTLKKSLIPQWEISSCCIICFCCNDESICTEVLFLSYCFHYKCSFALIQFFSFALIQKFSLCCQIFIIIYTSYILNIPIVFTVNMCFLGKDRTLSLFKHFDIDWAITIVKKFVVISKSLEISLIPLSGISLWCIIY